MRWLVKHSCVKPSVRPWPHVLVRQLKPDGRNSSLPVLPTTLNTKPWLQKYATLLEYAEEVNCAVVDSTTWKWFQQTGWSWWWVVQTPMCVSSWRRHTNVNNDKEHLSQPVLKKNGRSNCQQPLEELLDVIDDAAMRPRPHRVGGWWTLPSQWGAACHTWALEVDPTPHNPCCKSYPIHTSFCFQFLAFLCHPTITYQHHWQFTLSSLRRK